MGISKSPRDEEMTRYVSALAKFCMVISLMSGCASQTQIPLPLPPAHVQLPECPKLPIYRLTSKSSSTMIIKSYVASLQLDEVCIQQLRALWRVEQIN